jgi:hypothetical protein
MFYFFFRKKVRYQIEIQFSAKNIVESTVTIEIKTC